MTEPTLDTLIAHSDHGEGPQTLRAQMDGVVRRAAVFADAFGSTPFARWLGWWHDAGRKTASPTALRSMKSPIFPSDREVMLWS